MRQRRREPFAEGRVTYSLFRAAAGLVRPQPGTKAARMYIDEPARDQPVTTPLQRSGRTNA
jgi:hypothetical protein